MWYSSEWISSPHSLAESRRTQHSARGVTKIQTPQAAQILSVFSRGPSWKVRNHRARVSSRTAHLFQETNATRSTTHRRGSARNPSFTSPSSHRITTLLPKPDRGGVEVSPNGGPKPLEDHNGYRPPPCRGAHHSLHRQLGEG